MNPLPPPFDDPDWPLALAVLHEANGYEVDTVHVAPDVWDQLKELPRGEGEGRWGQAAELRIYRDRALADGDAFAILRNGMVRRLSWKRTTSPLRKSDE